MTTGHIFIATSLDGFIARPDGAIEWLIQHTNPDEDHGYDAFMAQINVIVMGRGTYQTVLAFDPWPYALPVVVLSRSLAAEDVPTHLAGQVRITALPPRAVMAGLAAEGYKRAYIDGGQIIQAFLRDGLIADMVITRVPVLIGSGRSLFGPLDGTDIALSHLQTQSFPSGLVQSHYQIAG
jgi:dihydrofolate reductase